MDELPRSQRIRQLLLLVPNRRRVFQAITDSPGTHLRELARGLTLAVGSVEHHLRHLQRHGLIFAHQDGRRRSYYVSGHIEPQRAALLHALGHPLRRTVAQQLLHRDGAAVSEIAQHMDEQVSVVSFHLRHLLRAGVVENVRAGRVSFYVLRDATAVAGALGQSRSKDNFAQLIRDALAGRGAASREVLTRSA